MATPPTFVSFTDSDRGWVSSFAAGTVYTISSVAVQTGDLLVLVGGGEGGDRAFGTPAGGGLTYTQQQKPNTDNDGSHTQAYIWTATASSTTSVTITATSNGTNGGEHGIACYVWRNSGGLGNSAGNEASGTAPSLALTTLGDNSAIVLFNADWNATDGTTRTWRTINSVTPTAGNGAEKIYQRDAASWAVYSGYWSDAGAAGSKTTGLSAPTGQTGNTVVIEVKGVAGTSPDTKQAIIPPPLGVPFTGPGQHPITQALQLLGDASGAQFPRLDETASATDSATVTVAVTLADTAAGDDSAAVAVAVTLADTATGSDTATVAAAVPLIETASGTDAAVITVPVSFTDTAAGNDGTLAVVPAVPLPETAAASDVGVLAVAAPLADTATGDDSLSVQSDAVIVVDPNQARAGFPWMLTSWRTSAGQTFGDATFPGGAQNVSLDDAAVGADALTAVAAVPFADTAIGTDTAIVAVAAPLSDGGNGDDSLSVIQVGAVDSYQAIASTAWMFASPRSSSQQNIGDTFSGPSALAEALSGLDVLAVAPAVPLPDTATATDALTVAAGVALAETAGGTDTVTATATIPLSDTAAGDDSLSVQVIGGSDQNQWLPPTKWGITRPGVAMDPPTMQLLGDASGSTLLSLTETATASDSLTISVAVVMTETAVGADALSAAVTVPLTDLVAASDSLALAAVVALSDTASSADNCTIAGQGVQGQGHGHGGGNAPGNVYPRSSRSIIGSAG